MVVGCGASEEDSKLRSLSRIGRKREWKTYVVTDSDETNIEQGERTS